MPGSENSTAAGQQKIIKLVEFLLPGMETKNTDLLRPPKVGELIGGKIVGLGKSSVYVDLGARGAGIIFGREFYAAKERLKALKIGDKIFAKVVDSENEEGYAELSLAEASKELSWEKLQKIKENDGTLKVRVLGANKGGLLAGAEGIQGFLPVSQLSPEHYPRVEKADRTQILQKLQKLIGEELEVKIFDINPGEQKLIFSEKAKETQRIKEILKNYKIGDVVEGEITGVVDFGAFIKISQELEGLIHISELDWSIIQDPSIVVKIGDKVKAKIIEITPDGRISLSLKALKKDPWEEVEKKYKKGDKISGKVTKFNPFGAFVEVEPKIQGLCHISEFGTKTKMEEKLKIGEKYDFQILQIDSKEHRMTLKLA